MFFEPIYLDIDLSGSQPVVRQTNNRFSSNCRPANCRPSNCRSSKSGTTKNILFIELPEYKQENIQVKINKSGRVNVNASKDKIVDTGRNGQRKTTVHVEQSFDLPEYVVEENMLKEVQSKYDSGKLIFSFPEKPVGVKMQINFEGDDEMVVDNDVENDVENEVKNGVDSDVQTEQNEKSEVVKKMVINIENSESKDKILKNEDKKTEDEKVDFEIVKMADVD